MTRGAPTVVAAARAAKRRALQGSATVQLTPLTLSGANAAAAQDQRRLIMATPDVLGS